MQVHVMLKKFLKPSQTPDPPFLDLSILKTDVTRNETDKESGQMQ